MRRASFFPLLVLSVIALGATGCDAILGLGDYKETNDPTAGTGAVGGGGSGPSSTSGSTTMSSASNMTTSSSTGGSCDPGMDYPCYDGPAMTENVGECRGGMHTCKADGATYTDCAMQVLPTAETCNDNKLDEDCDHAECILRTLRFGDDKDQAVGAIAVDAMGNVAVAGQFRGTLAFDATHTFTNAGSYPALYVAKFDPTGTVLFAKSFSESVNVNGLAFDSQGNVVLAGVYDGILSDIGPATLTCYDFDCSLLAKFDATGNVTLAQQIAIDQITRVTGIAIGASNSIYLWGDTSCGDQCSSSNFWLQKKSSAGTTTWAKTYTVASGYTSREAGGIAFEPLTGHVWVIGSFKGSEALGGTAITSAGGWDVVIGEIDSNGTTLSKRVLGDAADQFGKAVAIDSSANIYFTGSFAGKMVAGSNNLQSNGGLDTFVLRISSNGQYGWAKAYGGAGDQSGIALSVQPGATPTVVFTGNTDGSVDYGGGLLPGAGGTDAPLVKLNGADGGYMWSRLFGDAANQYGRSLVVLPDGRSVVGMTAGGTIDFGAGPVAGAGGGDVVVGTFGQ